jgi:hypothetical protein
MARAGRARGAVVAGAVMGGFAESVVEDAAWAWLKSLGWSVALVAGIAPEIPQARRAS